MMCGELNSDIEPIIPSKLPYELDEKRHLKNIMKGR